MRTACILARDHPRTKPARDGYQEFCMAALHAAKAVRPTSFSFKRTAQLFYYVNFVKSRPLGLTIFSALNASPTCAAWVYRLQVFPGAALKASPACTACRWGYKPLSTGRVLAWYDGNRAQGCARSAVRQHGRAVCGRRSLRENKTFFGDFLPLSKKLPARPERKL